MNLENIIWFLIGATTVIIPLFFIIMPRKEIRMLGEINLELMETVIQMRCEYMKRGGELPMTAESVKAVFSK